jgi:hypothetical protein
MTRSRSSACQADIEPFGAEPVRLHPVVSSLSSMGMAAFRTPLAAARFVARFAAE